MELQYSELEGNLRHLKVIGSLDILGVGQIETKFAGYCAGEHPRIVVDISQVDFLASIGIRLFIINAKSVVSRGGQMILVGPSPSVKSTLQVTGIAHLITIHDSMESALASLSV